MVTAGIDRLSGIHVCAYSIKSHGIGVVGLAVKRIQCVRKVIVAEFCTEQISGRKKGTETAVSRIPAVIKIIPEDTPDLMGFDIASESRSGGDSDAAVENKIRFHHDIQHTCGKQSAHGAAFQNQPQIHFVHVIRLP